MSQKMKPFGVLRAWKVCKFGLALWGLASLSCLPAWANDPGDVNGDGDITSIDASMTLAIVEGDLIPSADQGAGADGDQDGSITKTDYRLILQWASQHCGVIPPDALDGDLDLPELEASEERIGAQGGDIALPSGAVLSFLKGLLQGERTVRFSRHDYNELKDESILDCYRVSLNLLLVPGVTLFIPGGGAEQVGSSREGALLRAPEGLSEEIECAVVLFYNPWTRAREIIKADHTIVDDDCILSFENSSQAANLAALASSPSANQPIHIVLQKKETGAGRLRASKNILPDVPYYNQGGGTPYCWATCTAMALKYVMTDAEHFKDIKPWELVKTTKRENRGASLWTMRFCSAYGSFIEKYAGMAPERKWLWKDELKTYLKKQINLNRPVILAVRKSNHVILVVGYDDTAGDPVLSVHDSQPGAHDLPCMYNTTKWTFKKVTEGSEWSLHPPFAAVAIPAPPAPVRCVTISTQSKGESHKVKAAFVPPVLSPSLWALDFFPVVQGAPVVFGWYEWPATTTGLISGNGKEKTVNFVPNYYKMSLGVEVFNALDQGIDLKVKWELGSDSGENAVTVARRSHALVPVFRHDDLSGMSGSESRLNVFLHDAATDTMYDAFSLKIPFDTGISLSCEKSGADVTLKWNEYGKDWDMVPVLLSFDTYVISYSDDNGETWNEAGTISRDPFKTDYEQVVGGGNKEGRLYIVEAKYGSPHRLMYLTSDTVRVEQSISLDLVGKNDTFNLVYGIDVVGDYAYAASYGYYDTNGALRILDIKSNPQAPSVLGSLELTGARDVKVSGGYAFVSYGYWSQATHLDRGGLMVVDVHDPASPMLVAQVGFQLGDQARSVTVEGNTAYVVSEKGGLWAVDISNPDYCSNPPCSLVNCTKNVYADVKDAYDVAVFGDLAYLADGWGGLKIIDLTGAQNNLVASWTPPVTQGSSLRSVQKVGDYLYLADGEYNGNIWIVNVGDPVNPSLDGRIKYIVDKVVVSGNVAYTAGYGGVAAIDITDMAKPSLLCSYGTPNKSLDVLYKSSYLYVGDASGFYILRLIK
ncbi:MAG TPA: C39 family peptidase [Syntrophales bacterium]|nr:C39 family peptidase [Syntrophales bacterium]